MPCGLFFFFSSRRRHTRCLSDWSSDVCSSDLDRAHTLRSPARVRSSHDGASFRGSRLGADVPRVETCPPNKTNSWARSGQDRFNEGETSHTPRTKGAYPRRVRRDMRIAPFGLATRRTNALAPPVSTDEVSVLT